MSRDSAQKEISPILAAVTLPHHKVSGGNSFVVEANDEEEQKQIMLDIAKAIKGDVTKTSNGIYLILKG
ncbi:hypothetical protein P5G65_31355 [Paenibacillus chondroitinus]|uniref:Uncharacterized protein n=1 Tax=Paenibacillus chondroitinus TaxID=59842 RepID=A0ABU6DL02_9BACL|nr:MULTISPECIES: hypothetical protein [Paenibacillus]MCY9657130.1 hypothetical protein [Paenibacillus anseongense]MEB4798413.1 hypothetical protein [Paenibacillus chondroitinus]